MNWLKGKKPSGEGTDTSRLERIVALSNSGYCYIDLITGEQEFSPQALDILGLPEQQAQFDQLAFVFSQESFSELQQAIETIKQNREPVSLKLRTPETKKHIDCFLSVDTDTLDSVSSVVMWLRDTSRIRNKLSRITRENEKLKLDLKHFSSTFNAITHPIWRRGEDLAIRYCNLAFSEAAMESHEKVMESELLELHRTARNLAKQAQTSGHIKTEQRHIVVGGERRLYQITEIPDTADQSVVGYAVDITAQELIQEDLQRHISAQGDLLESSASAMAIYGADMRLRSYNFAFTALWKLDDAWLDTNPTYSEILEVLREKRRLPEQANFLAFKQQQIRLFNDLIAPQEEFFYLPDGKTLRVIAIPHALGGILFAYEDVTDRLALERSYNTLIAVQRATLDNLHEGVVVFGEDGRLKLCNPVYQKLWKLEDGMLSNDPHIGEILETTRSFYHYENWDEFKQELIAEAHLREVKHQRLERTDGSVIDMISVPLPDGATLITYYDVTDSTLVERSLRERNEALQEADRLKTEFLANVSYELRSPLTSIIGFSEMLQQKYFGDLSVKQVEYVEGIYHSSQHLMHLINDILDLASIEAGYMRLEVGMCEIHDMLSSVTALIKERAKEFGITLVFECPESIGKMLADETRIKQAVFNLLSNAIKYTDRGGKVTLGAEVEEGEDTITIWVEDNGMGIPFEEQSTVFEKFHKGPAPEGAKARGHKSGTGLGLPMVKSFIELHGGRVELISAPGEGTKVICRIPRNNQELKQFTKG